MSDRVARTSPLAAVISVVCIIIALVGAARHADAVFKAEDLRNQECMIHVD